MTTPDKTAWTLPPLPEDRPIQWIGLRHIGLNLFSADGWMPYDTGQESTP